MNFNYELSLYVICFIILMLPLTWVQVFFLELYSQTPSLDVKYKKCVQNFSETFWKVPT
jgi:hypothetical protein